MKRTVQVVSCAVVLLAAAGCGGSGGSTAPNATPARAEQARPLHDPALLERMHRAALDPAVHPMQGLVKGWDPELPKPNRAGPNSRSGSSYYGNSNAGQAGESILSAGAGGSSATYIEAFHTLYHGSEGGFTAQISMLTPGSNQIGDVLLYAPTMKGPNGDCFEAGTAYYNGGTWTSNQTHAYIYAFDFCGSNGQTLHPDVVGQSWFDKYVRNNGDGYPEYDVQICNCINSTTWSVRYYNYQTSQFDEFARTTGTYTGFSSGGWTQFETQYNVTSGTTAQCSPSLPDIVETSVRFDTSGGFTYLDSTNSSLYQPNSGETSYGAYGKCFNYNTNAASYTFSLPYSVRDSWKVTSSGY